MRFLLTILLLVLACRPDDGRSAGADSSVAASAGMEGMPGMKDMPGMEGMPGMAAGTDSAPGLALTDRAVLAGVTFAVAREAPVERTVRAVATAMHNEREEVVVHARVTGWVERLLVRETGGFVQAGDPLLELYAPELVSAQEELLLARRLPTAAGADSLAASARRRLRLWDISEAQIARIEASGVAERRLALVAPASGHVLERNVIQGQRVNPGDRLFRIVDHSTIWIEPAVFESDIALLRLGQPAEMTFDALPGHRFHGRVTFLRPELDAGTRTLGARIELPNPAGLIRPMMFGTVRIAGRGPEGVLVPTRAVLPTGTRQLVFVVRGGRVTPVEITAGARGDSTVHVTAGLAVGDTVIGSSAFLFDSESQLGEAIRGIMLNMGMGLDMAGMRMDAMPTATGSMEGMPMDSARRARRP